MRSIKHPKGTVIRRSDSRAILCMGCPRSIPAGTVHTVALSPVGSGIVLEAHYCGDACRARVVVSL